jgi:hypothetical protein
MNSQLSKLQVRTAARTIKSGKRSQWTSFQSGYTLQSGLILSAEDYAGDATDTNTKAYKLIIRYVRDFLNSKMLKNFQINFPD